jgi:hypothetical protein
MIFELQMTIQQKMNPFSQSTLKTVTQTPSWYSKFTPFDILSLLSKLLKKIIAITPQFSLMMLFQPIVDALPTEVQAQISDKTSNRRFELPEPKTDIVEENLTGPKTPKMKKSDLGLAAGNYFYLTGETIKFGIF